MYSFAKGSSISKKVMFGVHLVFDLVCVYINWWQNGIDDAVGRLQYTGTRQHLQTLRYEADFALVLRKFRVRHRVILPEIGRFVSVSS
jgi:hypothetical protein